MKKTDEKIRRYRRLRRKAKKLKKQRIVIRFFFNKLIPFVLLRFFFNIFGLPYVVFF